MTKPDYTEWLTPDRLAHEEMLWKQVAVYSTYADLVKRCLVLAKDHPEVVAERAFAKLEHRASPKAQFVLELGCGTGWVPTELPVDILYIGIDKHPECIRLAAQKNLGGYRVFAQGDIRLASYDLLKDARADVSCSFAVLKHFGLEEWDEIFSILLKHGYYSTFTMPILRGGLHELDDGTEFPHTWLSHARIQQAVAANGYEIVEFGDLEGTAEEWFIVRKA